MIWWLSVIRRIHVRNTMRMRIHERDHENLLLIFKLFHVFVMLSNPPFNSFGLFDLNIILTI